MFMASWRCSLLVNVSVSMFMWRTNLLIRLLGLRLLLLMMTMPTKTARTVKILALQFLRRSGMPSALGSNHCILIARIGMVVLKRLKMTVLLMWSWWWKGLVCMIPVLVRWFLPSTLTLSFVAFPVWDYKFT